MTQAFTTIPLSSLSIDKAVNVRKSGRGAEPIFAASIRARGIIQPLLVRKDGLIYKITDGGKRFEALSFMKENAQAAKGVAVDEAFPVPAIVLDENDKDAVETSLMSNIIRSDMHPVDEYRAFAKLLADGLSREEIATTYAMTDKEVDQVLALAALSPVILDAWVAGKISATSARAFTISGDLKEQEKVFKKLSAHGRIDDYDIKHELKANTGRGGSMVEFVGIEAYEKRGGKVQRDLFGSDHIVSNLPLAQKMVAERLQDECKLLLAKGWSFAVNEPSDSYNYGRVNIQGKATPEEKAELDKINSMENDEEDLPESAFERRGDIEEAIKLRGFTPALMAKSGCFVKMGHGGKLEIDFGRVKPTEKRAAAAAEKQAARKPTKSGEIRKAPTAISQAQTQRLDEQRTKAIRAALGEDSKGRPLDKLLNKIVVSMINPQQPYRSPLEITKSLDSIADAIEPKLLNAALRKAFDAQDYFKNAPKLFVLRAITEAVNADEARKISGKKRPEIAKFALTNVGKTKWLPPQLRTANYDGPAAKKKRAA